MKKTFCLLLLLLLSSPASAQYSMLLPAKPIVMQGGGKIGVNIALIEPFEHEASNTDRPQMFDVIHFDGEKMTRSDHLAGLRTIKYLGKQAWGMELPLEKQGVYQMLMETKPFWVEANKTFVQQFVKTILPVNGSERGWDSPAGLKFEIIPLTRPFGNCAPLSFTGKVMLNGKALENAYVEISLLNRDKVRLPSPYHSAFVAKTNSLGLFTVSLPFPGWWCMAALTEGTPLKGASGQSSPLEMDAILWTYVDGCRLRR